MGKQPIQLFIKIFPVSVAESQSHAEADNSVDFCFNAHIQNPGNIIFGVVNKGQNGREPYHRRYSGITHFFQDFISFPCGAYMGLQLFAQFFIKGGQCHLHHTFCAVVYFLQKIQIP